MRFIVMLKTGERMVMESDGWAEIARTSELNFGRLNIGLIKESDDTTDASKKSFALAQMARERYATEKWVQAYGAELKAKEESRKAMEYLEVAISEREKLKC